jgi:hypothetical protein
VTALGIEADQYDTIMPEDEAPSSEPPLAAAPPPADDGPNIADQGTVVG